MASLRLAEGALAACLALTSLHGGAAPSDPPRSSRSEADADMERRAREAMASRSPALRREALSALRRHVFRSSKAPQKEYCLFALGMLHSEAGDELAAVDALKKLERGWPESPYLMEAQPVLAAEALKRKRYKEAETRLAKAIHSDLPPAQRRRAQDLLMWLHVVQGQPSAGLALTQELFPLGSEPPSEEGLAALAITLCSSDDQAGAEQAVKSYFKQFPKGNLGTRVQLAWGCHLGALGKGREAAQALRKLLRDSPRSPEADEARLALATLLTEGKVPARIAKAFPDPATLVREMGNPEPGGELARRRLTVRLRLALQGGKWDEAMALAEEFGPPEGDPQAQATVEALQADAFRAYTRQHLEKGNPGALLPYLDLRHLQALGPESRLKLVEALGASGLPEAALRVRDLAPKSETAELTRTLGLALNPESHPDTVVDLVPNQARPDLLLPKARALAAKGDWQNLARLLPRVKPGASRIHLVLALLQRPGRSLSDQIREASRWLASAREKGSDKDPLSIRLADLRMQKGDWRGALAAYPLRVQPAHEGWVALQRATALSRLGRKAEAKAELQAHKNAASFKAERETLERSLDTGAPRS